MTMIENDPRLDDLSGEERRRRETLLLHRAGQYRLSDEERGYERNRKRDQRARRRASAREAAEAAIVAGSNDPRLLKLVDDDLRESAMERIAEEAARETREANAALRDRALAATAARLARETS